MNACARVTGNHVIPVSVVIVAGLNAATTDCGTAARMTRTGLYPRNAANNEPVGGRALIGAMRPGAPALVSDTARTGGKVWVRLTRIISKKHSHGDDHAAVLQHCPHS